MYTVMVTNTDRVRIVGPFFGSSSNEYKFELPTLLDRDRKFPIPMVMVRAIYDVRGRDHTGPSNLKEYAIGKQSVDISTQDIAALLPIQRYDNVASRLRCLI